MTLVALGALACACTNDSRSKASRDAGNEVGASSGSPDSDARSSSSMLPSSQVRADVDGSGASPGSVDGGTHNADALDASASTEPPQAPSDDIEADAAPYAVDFTSSDQNRDANTAFVPKQVLDAATARTDASFDDANVSHCTGAHAQEPSQANILLAELHADVLSFALNCDSSRLLVNTIVDLPLGNGLTTSYVTDSVLVFGGPEFLLTLPDERFEAIGPTGSDVWLFPEFQLQPFVWPGWQSYGVPSGALLDDTLEVHLEAVEGPGNFAAFYSPQDELSPPTYVFNPAEGRFSAPMAASTHVHMNWAFTAPGLYRLTFSVRGQLLDGTAVGSAEHTLRFFVGELAELPASEPTVLRIEGTIAASAPGESAHLFAARYGAESALQVTWFRAKTLTADDGSVAAGAWEPVATGDNLEVASNVEGYQFKASLVDGETEISSSQPVQPYAEQ